MTAISEIRNRFPSNLDVSFKKLPAELEIDPKDHSDLLTRYLKKNDDPDLSKVRFIIDKTREKNAKIINIQLQAWGENGGINPV